MFEETPSLEIKAVTTENKSSFEFKEIFTAKSPLVLAILKGIRIFSDDEPELSIESKE
jgi:hypothetical protein